MPLALDHRLAELPLAEPFHFAGHTFVDIPVLQVALRDGAIEGRGEGAGVYYLDDRPSRMPAQLEAVRRDIEGGLDRQGLRRLMPAGGARNALDCAMWALEAKRQGRPVWQLAGLPAPRPLRTTFTLSAESPEAMASRATSCVQARALKLKLTGETDVDIARVRAVRAARPEVWLAVDANQGYSLASIEALMPVLVDARVLLLEQPFARGREEDMRELRSPIPTAADESCLDLVELERVPGLFDVVNIKLDKCGGLTEGLMIARKAQALGLRVMVGNMGGSSLAMAPGVVLGQLCNVVDLDGPTILREDCRPGVVYRDGFIEAPVEVWA